MLYPKTSYTFEKVNKSDYACHECLERTLQGKRKIDWHLGTASRESTLALSKFVDSRVDIYFKWNVISRGKPFGFPFAGNQLGPFPWNSNRTYSEKVIKERFHHRPRRLCSVKEHLIPPPSLAIIAPPSAATDSFCVFFQLLYKRWPLLVLPLSSPVFSPSFLC